MIFLKLLRYLRGYVKFITRSEAVERFINLCAHHHIPLWGGRKKEQEFTAYTSVDGYRRIHSQASKAGVRTRILERHGLPFVLHRYRKRLGIAVGVGLFVLFLVISQQFIWVIQVEGCERMEPQQLVNALEELGVKRGTLKSTVDAKQVQQEMLIKVNDLAWSALNLRGTTATLVIRERVLPPQKIDTNVPANVVATQDGQIKRMKVTDGKAVLKVGDTVRAGEIIVSGIYEDRWGLTHLLRAKAQVTAHVPQTLETRVPLEQTAIKPTGEIIKRRYLEVMGARLPLFIYSGLDGDYKIERVTRAPEVLGFTMPFEITRECYIFYEKEQREINADTALHVAEQQLARLEREKLDGTVLSRQVQATVEDGVLTLTGEYLVETDIARQVEIPVFDRKAQEKQKKPREGGY